MPAPDPEHPALSCVVFGQKTAGRLGVEGREKARERNTHMWLPLLRPLLVAWPATQACAVTGN